jgi:SNF2 family DNA or RNA helicase
VKLDSGTDVEVMSMSSLIGKCLQYAGGSVYTDSDHNWEAVHDVKLKALDELIAQHNEPVIVAYTFRHEAERIMKRYPEAVWIKSGMSAREEQKLQKRWDAGLIPLLLCHPGSAGHGLNLQYGGNVIVWLTMNWSLELYLQLNKRIDRRGQTRKPIIYRLMMEETVDEVVASCLELKEASQSYLLRALQLYRETKQ